MDPHLENKNISVLMPVFNAEKYLNESINSILNQTYPWFELIILDDGSNDRTADVVRKIQKTDKRILFYQNPVNYGVAISRNILIKLSRYELVAWMDADDISHVTRLEKEIGIINNDPSIDLVCSQVDIIHEDGSFYGTQIRMNYSLYYDLNFFCSIPNPTVLCKKNAIVNSGGYLINKPPAEDFDLWSRLVRNYKVYRIEEPLLKYRIAPQSISNVVLKDTGILNTLEIVQKNITYYNPHYKIPLTHLSFFMEDFANNQRISIPDTIRFFFILRAFNRSILNDKNPNCNIRDIKLSIKEKKMRIVRHILTRIKIFRTSLILLISMEFNLLKEIHKSFFIVLWQKYV